MGVFGKGGAGKSTVVVLLAKVLRDRGYEVCVLDADSTNVGLHQALGLDESPLPLMEYYGGTVFNGGTVTCPVDDPTSLPGAEVFLGELAQKYVQSRERVFREANIKDVLYVLNRVRDRDMEGYMRRRLEKSKEPIGVIHQDPSIAMAWLEGTLLDETVVGQDIQDIIRRLEAAEEASFVS